jgi:hypothetical protein
MVLANAGSETANTMKCIKNVAELQLCTRDMLKMLRKAASSKYPLNKKAVAALEGIALPMVLSSKFSYKILALVRLNCGWYGSTQLYQFDIPQNVDELPKLGEICAKMLYVNVSLNSMVVVFVTRLTLHTRLLEYGQISHDNIQGCTRISR